VKKCLNMLPPLGATTPSHTNIDDIFDNYERIPTKFSVISILTSGQELGDF